MVKSRDVQEIVAKLSSDKAKTREVSSFLWPIFFLLLRLVAWNLDFFFFFKEIVVMECEVLSNLSQIAV